MSPGPSLTPTYRLAAPHRLLGFTGRRWRERRLRTRSISRRSCSSSWTCRCSSGSPSCVVLPSDSTSAMESAAQQCSIEQQQQQQQENMQILQWLFRGSHSRDHTSPAATSPGSSRRILSDEDEAKVNDLILFTRGGACPSSHEDFGYDDQEEEGEELNEKTIAILLTGEGSKTWFFSTLHLRNLYGSRGNRRFPPEAYVGQGMGRGVEAALVGCRVLPICDAAWGASKGSHCSDGASGKGVQKGGRRKAISRVKELVRWASAAKHHKGQKGWKVSYSGSTGNLKPAHDELSSRASKLNFRWEVGSCSTSSSVYSAPSVGFSGPKQPSSAAADPRVPGTETAVDPSAAAECHRATQWITTDSNFVVLEL